ncbi:MAG TPA: M81 family metallopeptidase [Nakamurella sp.]|nr:M81 family metallopeptidase [Nakamurella sp.]
MAHRVALAGLAREGNTFAGGVGTIDDFRQNTFLFGEQIFTVGRQNDSIAGAMQVAADRDIELVPTFHARSTSGPAVRAADHAELKRLVLQGLSEVLDGVDGIYLRLHGAMTAEGCDDVEGDLLTAVRELAGPDMPIAASFDLHTHGTATMAAVTPLIAGFQTYPHVDMVNTGRRAMTLLADVLDGRTRPTVGFRKIPVMSASEIHDTSTGPVAEVMARLHEIEKLPGVLDATIFCTQPWLDVTDYGWSVFVVTDDDADAAQGFADELAAALFDRRQRLVVTKEPLDAALARARKADPAAGPVVLGDGADSPSAGSTGDSADLLAAILAQPVGGPVLCSITDAPTVQACLAAGVGATVTTKVGGTLSPHFFSPIEVTGRVVTLGDGRFGDPRRPVSCGRFAVLAIGEVSLVVGEFATSMVDQRLYDRAGLDVSRARVVQAKSAGQYRDGYAGVAAEMIDLDMRGPAQHDLLTLPFRRIPRPIWPFDPDVQRGF